MSFFGNIKRALGFDADETELEEDDQSTELPSAAVTSPAFGSSDTDITSKAVTTTITETRAAALDSDAGEGASTHTEAPIDLNDEAVDAILSDKSLPADIFDNIIEVFNKALPDFVAKCIDSDEQRRELLSQLDQKLRRRLATELVRVRRTAKSQLAADRKNIEAQLAKALEMNKILDERQNETNAARLSAERQKRALNDRVHDLEGQVSKLEAEKEQYALETQSMLSRMRAAGVAAAMQKDAPSTAPAKETVAPDDETLKKAEAQHEADLDRIKALEADNAKLHDAIEQQKVQKKMSETMVNNLQSAAAKAREEAEQLRRELEEQTVSQAEIDKIEERLSKFEDVKKHKDDEIAALKAERSDLQAQLSQANENLKTNLRQYSFEEARLRRQIEKLQKALEEATLPAANITFNVPAPDEAPVMAEKAEAYAEPAPQPAQEPAPQPIPAPEPAVPQKEQPAAAEVPAPKPKRGRPRKKASKISAIEQVPEQGEWFGTQEAYESAPKAATASTADDDFGYKNPPRKSQPENDDQLSLW